MTKIPSFKQFLREFQELSKPITESELKALERLLDSIFVTVGMDVSFTKHFMERVNDARNGQQITVKELQQIFAKVYSLYARKLQTSHDVEAVIKDLSSKINIPVALNWDRQHKKLDLVTKTVMRKPNFKSPDPVYAVQT